MYEKQYSDDDLIAAYLKTHSTTKAEELIGCSYMTVNRAVKNAGIPLDCRKNNSGRHSIKITDDQLIVACKTMSRKEIAEAFKMHPESLGKRMKELGIHAVYKKPNIAKMVAVIHGIMSNWLMLFVIHIKGIWRCEHGKFN